MSPSFFWISFFVFIAVIPIGLIVVGIFLTRKSKFLQKIINENTTNTFAGLLYISSFLFEFIKGRGFVSSIIFAIVYIATLSVIWSSIATLLTNKFKFNKTDFYSAWFFGLLLMLYLFVRTQILGLEGLGFVSLISMFFLY